MNKRKELTISECYRILDRYKTPNIVVKHSQGCAKAAYLIGKKLNDKGEKIDLNSVVCTSLVHDIFKIIEVKDYTKYLTQKEVKENRVFWGKLKSRMKGYDHVSAFAVDFGKKYPITTNLVLKHRYSQVNNGFESWEEKLVYYADKLVKFDKITTLNERLLDLKERYGHNFKDAKHQKFIEETDKKLALLEKEIFKTSGLSPDDLIRLNKVSFKKLIKKDFDK